VLVSFKHEFKLFYYKSYGIALLMNENSKIYVDIQAWDILIRVEPITIRVPINVISEGNRLWMISYDGDNVFTFQSQRQ